MKPRLLPYQLTPEDLQIWFGVCCLFQPEVEDADTVVGRAIDADRRDAKLMFHLVDLLNQSWSRRHAIGYARGMAHCCMKGQEHQGYDVGHTFQHNSCA